ncbi:MAG: hypothetical protein AABX32_03515 [Nanoarchaeota archaeon]
MMDDKAKFYKGVLVKNLKLVLIVVLAAVLLLLFTIDGYTKNNISFKIEDKCGKFINLLSHTVEDENACKVRCNSQCQSLNYKFRRTDFTKNESNCNSCICYCG